MDTRRLPRIPVELECTLEHGNTIVMGTICDYNELGVFFKPDFGYVDGEMTSDIDSNILDFKDECVLTIEEFNLERSGEIRWSGYSPGHKCEGTGIEFLPKVKF